MKPMTIEEAREFFCEFYGGEHKIRNEITPCGFGWKIDDRNTNFATFDGSGLTKLVLLAHEKCVRVDIQSEIPQVMEICIWKREREGGVSERHPTIEQAIESFRKNRNESA